MTVSLAQILTAESIPKYLEERLEDLKDVLGGDSKDALDGLVVKPILGGNVNYAFCLTLGGDGEQSGKTIFLKQAPEFVAIFGPDGYPLTSQRMQREMDVYEEWKTILVKDGLDKTYLPEIYYFDKSHMVVIMEFLDNHELLDHVLVDANIQEFHPNIATSLGDFMGRTHAQTHATKLDTERIEYLTKHFENREMRDIQLEFVFTKCFKEATDEQRAGLELTEDFMKEVEELKQQYNGVSENNNLVLTHGDLHPGSVMVNNDSAAGGSTKVIDPEFTVYGPPGLDVGSLLSGYVLGAIHQAYSNNPTAATKIIESCRAIWDAYVKAMNSGGITDEALMKEIEIQSVGFTVMEVCRTALEFAGGRKWLQFEDPVTKNASKKAALQVVDRCMVARKTGGIELMLDELTKVVNDAAAK